MKLEVIDVWNIGFGLGGLVVCIFIGLALTILDDILLKCPNCKCNNWSFRLDLWGYKCKRCGLKLINRSR